MQGADLIVEGIAALVEAAPGIGKGLGQPLGVDALAPGGTGRLYGDLDTVDQAAGITIGPAQQFAPRLVVEGHRRCLERGQAALEHLLQFLFIEWLQHVNPRPRQQGRIHLEGRVLGGGTDKVEQAAFHIRQEGILLGLVEAVHLIDEQEAGLAQQSRRFGSGHRLADLLDATEHRRDRQQLAAKAPGHQARQGGLADARRPPENHRMGLPALERHAQRFARAEQMLLANHLVDVARAQPFRQRYAGAIISLG